MKPLRCCGRWCFWRIPLGPWCCSRCPRTYYADVPKRHRERFWEAVDSIVLRLDGERGGQ